MKCLILRKGKKKQEEKQITYWTKSGNVKQFDTAERLREIERETEFAALTLDFNGDTYEENIYSTVNIEDKVRSFLKTNLKPENNDKDEKRQSIDSLKLSPGIKVDEQGVIYRIATIVKKKKKLSDKEKS